MPVSKNPRSLVSASRTALMRLLAAMITWFTDATPDVAVAVRSTAR